VPQEASSEKLSGARRRRRLWITVGVLAAAVVVIAVLLAVLLGRNGQDGRSGSDDNSGYGTQVTSPYDLHEAPAETGPGDVERATLVSISLLSKDGKSDYYGLSADTTSAKALIGAVSGAEEIDAAAVASTTSTQGSSSVGQETAASTLTFLFPDRSTLAFDLYVAQGLISRGGHFWRVDGDLAALIEAAVSSQQ
jgi:hypothetical protein